MCVDFYYKLILINKFTKHNWVNNLCCDIKYFDLYLSLNVFQLHSYFSVMTFIYLFLQWFMIYLIRNMHKFFDLHLWLFM